MTGVLLYDASAERFIVDEMIDDLIPDQAKTVELHCGDSLNIKVNAGEWTSTRIEMDGDDPLYGWYFIGIGRCAPLIGHSVRL